MPEIKVMSTNGVASVLRELAPQFERADGPPCSPITLGARPPA